MKTVFELSVIDSMGNGTIEIVKCDKNPCVVVTMGDYEGIMLSRDLELFAVNILKALKSKKLSRVTFVKKKWKPKPFLD